VNPREKCHSPECDGKTDMFPLYSRGYDNKFKRAIKERIHERTGEIQISYGFICPICKKIHFRMRKKK